MKKIFSLFAAVLFAGSMMADPIVINASDVTTIASGATSGLDVTLQGINIVWQGAYYNSDGGDGGSASVDFRVYANKSMTLTAESNISKVEIAGYCKAGLTVTANAGTITTGASYASETTKGTLEDPLIVVDEIGATSVTLTCTKQMRAYTLRITLDGGVTPPAVATPVITGAAEFTDSVIVTITCSTPDADIYYTTDGTTDPKCDCSAAPEYKQPIVIKETTTIMAAAYTGNDWSAVATKTFTKVEPLADPTNCAEAAEAALSVSGNNVPYNDGKEYTIEGFVTSIATEWSEQYKNISFWMADTQDGGEVLQAFRAACAAEADAPVVGDKVAVTGKLTKYNTTPEFAAGCTFTITEKAEPEDPREVTKVGVNVPAENKPADNQIEMAGTFKEGTMNMEKIEATGWFVSYDFVNAAEEETFKLRSKENNNLVLCQFIPANGGGEGKWVQAIFTFGNYWSDDTWKGTPCKLIELDLSDGEVYAWKEGMPEPTPGLADPTNCAEAAAAALSVENNNDLYNDGKEYTIEGFVTSIQSAYSDQYHNVSFWMADTKEGGNVLEAYRAACETAADAPNVGDKVAVTGKLTKYGTTPEFAAGCTYTILERAEVIPAENLGEKTIAEFLELKNTKDTCILTGVVKNIVNTTYGNFDLEDETGKVYVYGLLTAEGEAKKFEELGIEENDTLTIKAVYNEYQGTPQAKNAVFVSVTKGEGGGEDENHPYDEDADFDVTFASYSIDDSDLADYGNLYIEASDEEGNYIILDITLPEGATGLVAGIYPVDDTYEYPAQTVTAGIYEEEVFYPSFAATLVEQEGQMYLDKIWWIVSGQVEVDEDLNITVDALNSLGKEVVAVLSGDPQTAVETTKVADRAVKFIENATLLIERNGVRYNVMGQVVR